MTEDRFEQRLREAAQDYHRPPEAPREEMWRRIVAARQAKRLPVIVARPWLRWGLGIAAILALGVGIGRWTASAGRDTATVAPSLAFAPGDHATLAYRVAAAQYLSRTEALLTGFQTEGHPGAPDAQFAAQARDLLSTTRLMLDSPAAEDARLRGLLEDLEVVLAQIAQLRTRPDAEDVGLINQGLKQRGVLLRLRSAIPAGPGPTRAQGAL